ncbi:hypothetical protein A2995_01760 [Candidatus Nomurabacteria bacterium RIFCSPLOWO2_01_FULL_33_24]|uniref:Uncharacterized protein n=1 Tax=Candidatus Nomurabacteria bacterium RIFCSPLOWO2_01_FULL_33_24 TaxID=1801765 RepID=A0A1F6X1T6_9BACT|nr:MAG: hypothetical protein A2995_01760 [Candidatus Nomurabacteria bacterium RIFCSPLOWO2_01_FULL_33_24]
MNYKTEEHKNERVVANSIFGTIKLLIMPWKGEHNPDLGWLNDFNTSEEGIFKVFCQGCGIHTIDTEKIMKSRFEEAGKLEDFNSIDWKNNYLHLNTCEFCLINAPVSTMEIVVKEIPPI